MYNVLLLINGNVFTALCLFPELLRLEELIQTAKLLCRKAAGGVEASTELSAPVTEPPLWLPGSPQRSLLRACPGGDGPSCPPGEGSSLPAPSRNPSAGDALNRNELFENFGGCSC